MSVTTEAGPDLHSLYRFYDHLGQLLYVGITNNPPRRFSDHRRGKDWWSQVASIDIEHLASREDLRSAERSAIEREAPLYNVRMNGVARVGGLVWSCDYCGNAVLDGDGYLQVERDELEQAQESPRSTSQGDWTAICLKDVRPLAKWRIVHIACDPDPDGETTWVPVERCRTAEDMLDRTAHLMRKPWIGLTDWHVILGRATGQRG